MRLSPLDIRKQQFPRSFRGFNIDAVLSFKDLLANELEELIRQNSDYANRIKRLEEKVDAYVKIEQTINGTLVMAQKTADEARTNAQKEAELIVKEAVVRAEHGENEIRARMAQLEADLASLRNQRDAFFARFRGLLTTQLNLLEAISGEETGQIDAKDVSRVAGLSDEPGEITTVMEEPPAAPDQSGSEQPLSETPEVEER